MIKNLHESWIKDVLDTIVKIGDTIDTAGSTPTRKQQTSLSVSSISRASKDLIMSFPVLCDNSIDPKTAAMISKAVERKAVTMLQLLFASCSFNGTNGREILAQWHNNIDGGALNMSLDDYLDLCNRFSESCDSVEDRRAINEAVRLIKIEMKNGCKSYPVSSISEHSINDYKVTKRYGKTVVMEANNQYSRTQNVQLFKAKLDNINSSTRANDAQANMFDAQANSFNNKNAIDKVNGRMNMNKAMSDIADKDTVFLTRQLMDSDVKKCNELVPSLMIVKFRSGENEVEQQFVAGVKARLVPIDSKDIIDRIVVKNKDRSGLVNLIKATTKEISFVKDYLLAIDKAKLDAKNNSIRNKSSRIWKTLEKRATKSVWRRLRGKTNDAGCITTLVVSQEIANLLYKEYNINLGNVKVVSDIMDAYNLLAFVIVDESTEIARFLYDGDDTYEDLSFNSLERESGDGSYKKVINLLSKMNRG